jgi:hypothetical protein
MRRWVEAGGGRLVLDGGLATELEANGADLNDPLWSAKCLLASPHLIRKASPRPLCPSDSSAGGVLLSGHDSFDLRPRSSVLLGGKSKARGDAAVLQKKIDLFPFVFPRLGMKLTNETDPLVKVMIMISSGSQVSGEVCIFLFQGCWNSEGTPHKKKKNMANVPTAPLE